MTQDEYFVIERENNQQYPLFDWDQKTGPYGMGKPVEPLVPIKLKIGSPEPIDFELVDYHSLPEPVVSKRLKGELEKNSIYGVQFVPAELRDSRNPFSHISDYYYIHIWIRISCIDEDASDLERYDDGAIFSIDELVLDERKLNLFDLPKRLVFQLTENTSTVVIHESIKDIFESLSAKGCRFFKISDWNSDSTFI